MKKIYDKKGRLRELKLLRRCMAYVISVTMLMCMIPFASYAETTETTETLVEKNINIAYHKNVESLNDNASLLTDGLFNTTSVSGNASENETFTVDLERLVRITAVILWPAQTDGQIAGSKMSNVALEVSADGKEWETIDTQNEISNSLDKNSAFVCSLEGEDFYKYVRVRKTQPGAYEYGELQVFADVNAVEISRNKEITATSESDYRPDLFKLESTFDGDTANYAWLVESSSNDSKCIAVDFGKEMYADWVEMYTRRGIVAGASYHRNWSVYGLEEGDKEYLLAPEGVGTKIFTSLATSATEANFPVNIEDNDPNNHLFETLDGMNKYRYMSFYKSSLNLGLSEIGVFTIMPEAAKTVLSGKTVTVSFSEKMDTTTFDAITVKIEGKEVFPTFSYPDEYTLKMEFEDIYYNARVDVVIPEEVKSARDVAILPTVESCYFPQAVESSEPVFLNGTSEDSTPIDSIAGLEKAGVKMTFRNNQPETAEKVIMVAVLYNKDHTIVKMDEKKVTLEPKSEAITLTAGFDLPEDTSDCILSVFVWKNYRFMSPWLLHKSIS